MSKPSPCRTGGAMRRQAFIYYPFPRSIPPIFFMQRQ